MSHAKLIEDYARRNPGSVTVRGVNTDATEVPRKATVQRQFDSEKDFQAAVIALAQERGWKVAHFRPLWSKDGKRMLTAVSADGVGWPDLFCVHPVAGRCVALELKYGRNTPSEKQKEWLLDLARAGIFSECCWPEHWDRIEELLKVS